MALMDAKEYDPRPVRRRLAIVVVSVSLVTVFLILWFWPSGRFRYLRQWNIADHFFTAVEHRNFDEAYGMYNADPEWKQHPEKYNKYTLPQFTQDWGPSSEFGTISSHKIECAIDPPQKGFQSPSGVVLLISVNHRSDPTLLWVEKKSGTLSASPLTLEELTRNAPLVRAVCNGS
ncbi:MAG TPA: hypothetical protein VLA83_16245 [Candidatus Binatia bacterium]|nr:hypothetical protein [Candidatus Binatia bacterium]